MIMKSKLVNTIFFFLFLTLLGSCSTTLVGSWSDASQLQEPIKTILILGVMRNDLDRRTYEDTFVEKIGKHGIIGIAGYTVMPNQEDYDDADDIRAAVEKTGSDAALIARLVSVDQETTVVPASVTTTAYRPSYGYGNNMYDYYGRSYSTTYNPGYTTVDTIVTLETTVFSTGTEEMIWAGSTRSFNPGTAKNVVNGNADVIVKDMKKAGLLD